MIDENYNTRCAFTDGWIADHPQAVEDIAAELVALWLRGKSRVSLLRTWCEARQLVPIHFFKVAVLPVEQQLAAEGWKPGSLKK